MQNGNEFQLGKNSGALWKGNAKEAPEVRDDTAS